MSQIQCIHRNRVIKHRLDWCTGNVIWGDIGECVCTILKHYPNIVSVWITAYFEWYPEIYIPALLYYVFVGALFVLYIDTKYVKETYARAIVLLQKVFVRIRAPLDKIVSKRRSGWSPCLSMNWLGALRCQCWPCETNWCTHIFMFFLLITDVKQHVIQ